MEINQEKMPRSFRCIPKMARLQWAKLQCEKFFRWVCPNDKRVEWFCIRQAWYFSFMAVASAIIVIIVLMSVPIFRLRDIDLSWRSSLSRIIMYGPSLSREKVYFFNITNPEDFLETGGDLNVTEVGPYVYRVRTERRNPVLDDEDETISYNEVRKYEFIPDESNGSLDDEITTWNGPFIIVAESLKKSNRSFRLEFLSSLNLTMESVIIKKKVNELIFGHYHDDLLEKASLAHLSVPYKEGNFSWLDKQKKEDFTVSSGISKDYPGTVKEWNGRDKLDFWNGDTCNKIDGAISDVGPPYTYQDYHYSLFLPDLCRSLILRAKDGEWAYQATEMTFANSTENPDNHCYETQGARPSGVYSVSSCRSGAPLWISFPHFYLGDPSYAKNINGLKASSKQHDSYFKVFKDYQRDVELKLSTQINIEVGEICDIPQFNNVSKGIYPILWSTVDIRGSDRAWWLMSFVVLNALHDIFGKCHVVILMWALNVFTILYMVHWIPLCCKVLKASWVELKITFRVLKRKKLVAKIKKLVNKLEELNKSKLKGKELSTSECI